MRLAVVELWHNSHMESNDADQKPNSLLLELKMSNTAPALFVTTYAVGNRYGFATGKWFNLDRFENHDEFLAEITAYAKKRVA